MKKFYGNGLRAIAISALILVSSGSLFAHADDQAPGFKLPVLHSDSSISLSDYRGKIVYVDFWASWCGPCRKSLPLLSDMRDRLKDAGDFEILAINLDAKTEDAERFLKEFPVTYPVLLDPKGTTSQKYDLVGMPTSYLIDQSGDIVSTHQGFRAGDIEKIEAEIALLRKRAGS